MTRSALLWLIALMLSLSLIDSVHSLRPCYSASSCYRLGLFYHQRGDIPLAREYFDRTAEQQPTHPRVHHSLALLDIAAGRFDAAARSLRTSISLTSNAPAADSLVNLGNSLAALGQIAHAVESWNSALQRDPLIGGSAVRIRMAQINYADALASCESREWEKCRKLLIQSIRLASEAELLIRPDSARRLPTEAAADDDSLAELTRVRLLLGDGFFHLAAVEANLVRTAESVAAANKSLNTRMPMNSTAEPISMAEIHLEAQNFLSHLLEEFPDLSESAVRQAESRLSRSIFKSPRWTAIIDHLHKSCQTALASQILSAQQSTPRLLFSSSNFPYFFASNSERMQVQSRYREELHSMIADPSLINLYSLSNLRELELPRFRFYLSYLEENNVATHKLLNQLFIKIAPEIEFIANHLRPAATSEIPSVSVPLKICFVSAFFSFHPVGRQWVGFVEYLALKPEQYSVCVISIGLSNSLFDPVRDLFRSSVPSFHLIDSGDVLAARNILGLEKPDFIVFGELGLEFTSFFLAFSRLAPVQLTSFGHPDTSGIPAIDYFLSYKSLNGDQNHFSERLIHLDGLPHFANFSSTAVESPEETRKYLRLPLNSPLFLISKSAFYFSPDFLTAVARILIQNPIAAVVLLVVLGINKYGTKIHQQCGYEFANEIARRAAVISGETISVAESNIFNRIYFVDRGDSDHFDSVVRAVDAVLMTFPMDGFTTAINSLAVGTPFIAFSGRPVGGQMARAILKQIEMDELIANSVDEYVAIAGRLVSGANSIRLRLLENIIKFKLFDNENSFKIMEKWFIDTAKEKNLRNFDGTDETNEKNNNDIESNSIHSEL